MFRAPHRLPHALVVLPLLCAPLIAQGPPPNYYASVNASNATTLRATLHAVIDDHTRVPYTASATDTWDVLALASENPTNTTRILDVYGNASLLKQTGGNSVYNREHTWPNSYGFPVDGGCNYPYTDCHMLFLSDIFYNSERGNAPFRAASNGTEYTTVANAGLGGGSGVYPGNSNWSNGSTSSGSWETWIGRRGDVARAILYADLRYEGGTHAGTGCAEPDLIVTDTQSLIANSSSSNNTSVAYMGIRSVLLQWHQQDPPDAWEMRRNDVVFGFQGNRNPFIDHPEWVNCLYNGACTVAVAYCTSSTTTNGCVPAISASGSPSVTANSGFVLSALSVEGQRSGLIFYGTSGAANSVWAIGSTSFLCVKAPTQRMNSLNSGGANNTCTGVLSTDWLNWLSTHPNALGQPFSSSGVVVRAQAWFRDPPAPKTTNLSDGLEFVTLP
jgi:endonuclease I